MSASGGGAAAAACRSLHCHVRLRFRLQECSDTITSASALQAYLSYRITDQVYQEKKLVELTYLFVPESYREKGLGQQLTTVFFTFLKGNNYACKIENKEVREYVCNKVLSDKSNLALKDIRWEADKNICIC